MSVYSRCEQTWVDGKKYFDRKQDRKQRNRHRQMRAALIQRILTTGADMLKPGETNPTERELWPRHDLYCGHHDHGHGHGHEK